MNKELQWLPSPSSVSWHEGMVEVECKKCKAKHQPDKGIICFLLSSKSGFQDQSLLQDHLKSCQSAFRRQSLHLDVSRVSHVSSLSKISGEVSHLFVSIVSSNLQQNWEHMSLQNSFIAARQAGSAKRKPWNTQWFLCLPGVTNYKSRRMAQAAWKNKLLMAFV